MQKYKTLQVVRIGAGELVMLDDRQAKDRQHVLQAKGKGLYEALTVLEFKAGEVIGLKDPGKRLWEVLVPEGQEQTIFDLHHAKAKADAEALAKAAAEKKAKAKGKKDAEE